MWPRGLRGRRCRLVLLLRASQAVGSGKSQRDGLRSRCVLVVGQVSHPELTGADRHGVRTARSTLNRVPRSSAFARAFKRSPDAVGCTCICTCAPCGCWPGVTIARPHSSIRVRQGLRIRPAGLLLSAHMSTPTVITSPTWAARLPVTSVPYVTNLPQRCSGALGHIYGLAEDGEWHCHLPQGHDGVCLALDGTRW
jgi:hypothetical protein